MITPQGPVNIPIIKPIIQPLEPAFDPPDFFVNTAGIILSRIVTASAATAQTISSQRAIVFHLQKYAHKSAAQPKGGPGITGTIQPIKPIINKAIAAIVKTTFK